IFKEVTDWQNILHLESNSVLGLLETPEFLKNKVGKNPKVQKIRSWPPDPVPCIANSSDL
ncbi:MAG: hypothetical protein WD431_03095, partial [Cyclobacteriaceae bacterium]